uniref:Uncharacterized protein LOC102801057 n=1 Tax=Saccoglossus kowalevskii TaxID=10224 RepID=A0ABM0MHJ8_SACKO|nr:PREDICTED: uncharacterized protein LOC102801057 [Saccoglossus kowalevskii]
MNATYYQNQMDFMLTIRPERRTKKHGETLVESVYTLKRILEQEQLYYKTLLSLQSGVNLTKITSIKQMIKKIFRKYVKKTQKEQRKQQLEKKLSALSESMKTVLNQNINKDITEKEVQMAVKRLKNNKACGPDGIPSEMLKYSSVSMIKALQKMFNQILKNGQYPDNWSISILTPIHKQGNYLNTNNYRGVSVNSNIGKLFNAVLNRRLIKYLEYYTPKSRWFPKQTPYNRSYHHTTYHD